MSELNCPGAETPLTAPPSRLEEVSVETAEHGGRDGLEPRLAQGRDHVGVNVGLVGVPRPRPQRHPG